MNKVVVVGGLYRSGSTWQYNCLRIALQAHYGEADVFAGEYHNFKAGAGAGRAVQLVKSHRHYADLSEAADLVFTSYRPFAEAVKSWQRFMRCGFDEAYRWMSRGLDHFHHWQIEACYCQEWYDFQTKAGRRRILHAELETLQDVLALDSGITPTYILKRMEAVRPPSDGMDPDTLLYSNHFTKRTAPDEGCSEGHGNNGKLPPTSKPGSRRGNEPVRSG